MASPPPSEIIDNALFCNTTHALAYYDPDQKWLIRKHLLSLHNEFSSLYPIVGMFAHDDGTMVNLLKAEGFLHISQSLPSIHVSIWIHEHYPHLPPIVHVTSNPTYQIRPNHPFVNPSGFTTSSYLHTWGPYGHDLLGLAYNLVKIFSLDHPFYFVTRNPTLSHPSYMSKTDCMDRLWWTIHYDMMTLRKNTNDEVEGLTNLQGEMRMHDDVTTSMIIGLDHERVNLKKKVKEMTEESDVLINWLAVNKENLSVAMGGKVEDAFDCVDVYSELALDWVAEDKTLEDLMYALEKALEKGVVSYEHYIRQVRKFAREQFFFRAKIERLKDPHILKLLD